MDIKNALIPLGVSIVLGLIISVIYMKTAKKQRLTGSFTMMLSILPSIIGIVILLVGTNLASAFSLGGVFSIIRFRSEVTEPKDMAYVLMAMAVGLACGMGFMVYAIVVTLILCVLMIIFEITKFGTLKLTNKILKIAIPEDLDYKDAFKEILEKYTKTNMLTKVKTTDLGSLYELAYNISMEDSINEKDFLDELRTRNGNLNITLVLGE